MTQESNIRHQIPDYQCYRGGVLLSHHFDYWDAYISKWLKDAYLKTTCLTCDLTKEDNTYFLPEPWWGWNGDPAKPLNSVCININPGGGDCCQCPHVLFAKYGPFLSYRELMPQLKKHFIKTEYWHTVLRARALQKNGESVENSDSHLSLELWPEHSKFPKAVYNESLKKEKERVRNHVLSFAAEAAKIIIDPELRNKVIVRLSPKNFIQVLKNLDYNLSKEVLNTGESVDVATFKFSKWPETDFIAMRGVRNKIKGKDIESVRKGNQINPIQIY